MANSSREKLDQPFGSDAELVEMVEQFERCDWPYALWTHRTHLAVGLYYLTAYSFDEALARVRRHIDLYNRTRGDPKGYHETVTVLFLRRIHRYLNDHPNLASMVAALEELVAAFDMRWPLKYYSAERLWSVVARRQWVEPDRQALDF